MDGGSDDETLAVLDRWKERLAGWRSHADGGQSEAINEGIARGRAPYVCWLNSDDWLLPQGLSRLLRALEANLTGEIAPEKTPATEPHSAEEDEEEAVD